MRIYGDTSSKFVQLVKEGNNDVLQGKKEVSRSITSSFFGTWESEKIIHPGIYLHIPKNCWSIFTAVLRKNLLFWRWHTVYLDRENGTHPQKILICTCVRDGKLPNQVQKLLGQSWFITNLIKEECYEEIFGKEYLIIKNVCKPRQLKIFSSDPIINGVHIIVNTPHMYCHIYRKRGLYSILMYYFLKFFSNTWKEVTISMDGVSETMLIQKKDQYWIKKSNLLQVELIGRS